MNQSRKDARRGQAFQVLTRFAKSSSVKSYGTDLKLTPNEMIQWDTAGDQISPRRSRRDSNFPFALESFDGLDFN